MNAKMINNIHILNSIEEKCWDEFVQNHPHGWICHLSYWQKLLENTYQHMRGYYLVKYDQNNEKIVAGLPIYFVRSRITGKRLVSIPFATLCDPLISVEQDLTDLLEGAIDLMHKLKANTIEVRTYCLYKVSVHGFLLSDDYKNHILNLDRDPEELMKCFHKKSIRIPLLRSLNSGLLLSRVKCESDLKSFYSLYVKKRKEIHLPPQPYSFFLNLWRLFSPKDMVDILLAKSNTSLVGGLILLKYKDRVSAEYSAVDSNYSKLNLDHYLLWKGINVAYSEKRKYYDFGRTLQHNAGLMDFKNRWGTEIKDLNQYFHFRNPTVTRINNEKSVGYRLVKRVSDFIPIRFYPAFGKYCYKHLG